MNYLIMPGLKKELMKSAMGSVGLYEVKADEIVRIVADHFGMEVSEVKTKTRKIKYVMARKMCFYFLRQYTKMSLKSIGEMFGGQDHTTAIHGIQSLADLRFSDPMVNKEVIILDNKINA